MGIKENMMRSRVTSVIESVKSKAEEKDRKGVLENLEEAKELLEDEKYVEAVKLLENLKEKV